MHILFAEFFLSASGNAMYRRVKDVLHPQVLNVSLDSIIEKMSKHLQPAPSEIVQRRRFHMQDRLPNESVAAYVVQLKRIAQHCNFGDSAHLQEMLRNCLVCGITNNKWQQCLLVEEGSLSYNKTLKLLLALEAAKKEVKLLTDGWATAKPQPLQYVLHKRSAPSKQPAAASTKTKPCYRCGGAHDQAKCRFRSAECYFCRKKGHIASVYRQKAKRQLATNAKPKHTVTDEDASEQPEYPMYTIKSATAQPISVELRLNDEPVTMKIDTGATLSIMNKNKYLATWPSKTDAPRLYDY